MKSSTHRNNQLIARIAAAGIPIVAAPEKDEVPEMLIRQDVEAYDSRIFDVNAGTGLILPLKVTANMPVFCFSGVAISFSRWPNPLFRPLEETGKNDWPNYQFGGRSDLKFSRAETINGIIEERKQLHRGYSVHGLLLAFSHEPMPDDLGRGEILSGSISLYDQFEHKHAAEISVRVDRETAYKPELYPDSKRKSPWKSFLEGEERNG